MTASWRDLAPVWLSQFGQYQSLEKQPQSGRQVSVSEHASLIDNVLNASQEDVICQFDRTLEHRLEPLDHAYLAKRVAQTVLALSLIPAGLTVWKDYGLLQTAVVQARVAQAQGADARAARIAKAKEKATKKQKGPYGF